jgi:hypothetical protein
MSAGYIEGQVQRPTKSEGDGECDNPARRIVQVLGIPSELGFRLRHKDLITLEGASVGVMAPMTIFPREVRHHQSRVKDKPNGVINQLVITEGMVATFMGDNPNTSANTTLADPVNRPCNVAIRGWKEVDVSGGDVVHDGDENEVIHNIGERANKRPLKAVRWNGFLDITNGERRL